MSGKFNRTLHFLLEDFGINELGHDFLWQKLLAGTWHTQYLVWTKEGGKTARLLMTTFFYCSAVLII